MDEAFPPNPRDVIHPHRMETVGYLVAFGHPCADIVREEVRLVKRTLVASGPARLPSPKRPKSWVLAVLVCPGATVEPVVAWIKSLSQADRERVYVYLNPRCDAVTALAPWYAAGLDDPIVSLAHDFRSFHKSFGARMNLQTYLDFR